MKDLETENLRIRKFRIEDAEDVYNNLATERKLEDCIGYNFHKDIEQTKIMVSAFVREYEMNELVWAIEDKKTNMVIGFINALEKTKINNYCKIKFGIGLKWIDSGLMEEALTSALKYIFEELKFHIVISQFYDGSEMVTTTKKRMLENIGMKQEAKLRDRKINEKNGKFENILIYSITDEEFHNHIQ